MAFLIERRASASPALLVARKNVCLMRAGKGEEWVKEAYSIVLMQMHANAPEGEAKQHRIRASPWKGVGG